MDTIKLEGKRYYHSFLPPDDEANLIGYWVPSPARIEIEKHRIRYRNNVLMRSERRKFRKLQILPAT